MMTNAELIEHLQRLDPDAQALLALDAEGNEYSPVDYVESMFAPPGWSGGRTDDLLAEDWFEDEGEDTDPLPYTRVVTIFPV